MLRDSFLIIHVILSKIILAIAVSWIICAIITVAGGFPSDPSNPQYKARTDARIGVLKDAKWFRFPYPGKACIVYSSLHETEAATTISHTVIGSFISSQDFFPIVDQTCSGFVFIEGSTTLPHSGLDFYSDLSSDNPCWYSTRESEKNCHPRARS